MMGYGLLAVVIVCIIFFVGKEVACDIRNPRKGHVNEEVYFSNVPKIKTRAMYSSYER